MPFDPRRYPSDWKAISLRIRERSGWRCEWCGAANGQPHPVTGSRVVLTVAHIDHDTTHNTDDNLAALCQRCHLTYDAKLHARHAAQTRRRQRDEATGQLALFEVDND